MNTQKPAEEAPVAKQGRETQHSDGQYHGLDQMQAIIGTMPMLNPFLPHVPLSDDEVEEGFDNMPV